MNDDKKLPKNPGDFLVPNPTIAARWQGIKLRFGNKEEISVKKASILE